MAFLGVLACVAVPNDAPACQPNCAFHCRELAVESCTLEESAGGCALSSYVLSGPESEVHKY